jgi:hypothetical protein
MHSKTRSLFKAYVSQIALLNGIDAVDASGKFAVDPSVEQKLEGRMRESSEFLQRINVFPVLQQTGDKVGIDTTRPLASRTNTAGGTKRNPGDPTDSSELDTYFCRQTNFDWSLRYAKLDAWRHRPEFQTLIRDAILRQQARDRIMIGFNGTSIAATTDVVANPLLQDVNEGWLHKIRTRAPARVLSDGDLTVLSDGADNEGLSAIYVTTEGELFTGANATTAEADYRTLDALVTDAIELQDEWHRDDTELVVIVGRDLVHDKYFNIINNAGDTATEVEARDRILKSEKQIGGLPAARVPFFPANALLITTFDNLSIYWQEETRRRTLKDEPELDRIANYESVNEDYVVEEYGKVAFVENIVMGPAPARPAP